MSAIAPQSVAVGDFNGDGKQDLAVANNYSKNVSILLGDGTGNFSAATNFPVFDQLYSVGVGDFNGDGKQDLATVNWVSDSVAILLGDGTGSFGAPTDFTVGDTPRSVAVGDFNGDGRQDLAVARSGFPFSVSILLRDCPQSQITPVTTTCSEFSSGTAQTLGSVQYNLNQMVIHQVDPIAFVYWVRVTAPAGDNTFRITQTITTDNFNTLFEGNGSNVFDAGCARLDRTIRKSGETVIVKFNAPAAGTYFIAIKLQLADRHRRSRSHPKNCALRIHDGRCACFNCWPSPRARLCLLATRQESNQYGTATSEIGLPVGNRTTTERFRMSITLRPQAGDCKQPRLTIPKSRAARIQGRALRLPGIRATGAVALQFQIQRVRSKVRYWIASLT